MIKGLLFSQLVAIILKLFVHQEVSWLIILIPTFAIIVSILTLIELGLSMYYKPYKWIKSVEFIADRLEEISKK